MLNVVKEIIIDIDKSNGIYLKKYDTFTRFVLGYSKVTKDNKTSYIDIYGNDVILTKEMLKKINEYNNKKSNLHVDVKNRKYGFIDNDNNIVIDYKYDFAREFSDRLAYVTKNNISVFIDEKENVVLLPLYKYIGNFIDDYAPVKNEKWGIIDKTGRELFPCIASEIMILGCNRVYIDGYMYDISKIKFKYILTIEFEGNLVKREFDSKNKIDNYEKILYSTINNIVKKCDYENIKKLTINN